jgi:hypothetical protein
MGDMGTFTPAELTYVREAAERLDIGWGMPRKPV